MNLSCCVLSHLEKGETVIKKTKCEKTDKANTMGSRAQGGELPKLSITTMTKYTILFFSKKKAIKKNCGN